MREHSLLFDKGHNAKKGMRVKMESQKAVCFTGHRKIPDDKMPEVLSRLYSAVAHLIFEGYTTFICGGALGFDTLCAQCVLKMKERFPHIKLVLALPCRDQTLKWDDVKDISTYKEILGKADLVEYMQPFYTSSCMHERNRWMVDHSSLCVAYLTSYRSGTAYTYNYAKKKGLGLINIADEGEEKQLSFI